jgi:hypothetical protein
MQPARRRGVVSSAHRRRDGAGARGVCARSVARAGRSGTARRTGLAGAADASGTVFGACHVALLVQSKMLAGNTGVSAEDAANEWTANVIPGITILPSGVWGVNRAQEAGCTYCAGG